MPSEICCAFLYGQLEMLDAIGGRRRGIYEFYRQQLQPLEAEGLLQLPVTPEECTSNYHLFYILLPDGRTRDALLALLKSQGIHAVLHYVPLHTSPMGAKFGYREGILPVTEQLSGRLVRLPFYYEITQEEQTHVVDALQAFVGAAPVAKSVG